MVRITNCANTSSGQLAFDAAAAPEHRVSLCLLFRLVLVRFYTLCLSFFSTAPAIMLSILVCHSRKSDLSRRRNLARAKKSSAADL